MASRDSDTERSGRPRRLSPAAANPFAPWRRADQMQHCSLFWMPVDSFPLPGAQRAWALEFMDRLSDVLLRESSLQCELFLQFKTVHTHLRDEFIPAAQKHFPMVGLSRKPGVYPFPPGLTKADVPAFQEGRRQFEFGDYIGDYSYWFAGRARGAQRRQFFGYGGMTAIYVTQPKSSPVPAITMPKFFRETPAMQPLLQEFDVEEMFASLPVFFQPIFRTSKQVFGRGLEDHPQFKGLLYIIPLLDSRSVFAQDAAAIEEWFRVFDVYLCECPQDKGLLLASRHKSIDTYIASVLEAMRSDGLEFPLR